MTESVKAFLQEMAAAANADKRHWQTLGKMCARLAALVDVYPSWGEILAGLPSTTEIRRAQESIDAMRNFISASLTEMLLAAQREILERKGEHK